MKKGDIYFHDSFVFRDGELGEKYLILLNEPGSRGEPYLFCRTTSQKKNKPSDAGCHVHLSLFFIPAKTDYFIKNTWLQFYDIYPFDSASVLRDAWAKCLRKQGELNVLTIKQVLGCIGRCADIEIQYKEMILK